MNNLNKAAGQEEYVNGTGSAISSGAPVDLTDRVGIAAVAIASLATGIVYTVGQFKLAKNSETSFAQGADVDWDTSESQCDELGAGASGDFLHIGKCMKAVTTESYLIVDINVAITMTTVS